jgi:hypothetical protein
MPDYSSKLTKTQATNAEQRLINGYWWRKIEEIAILSLYNNDVTKVTKVTKSVSV